MGDTASFGYLVRRRRKALDLTQQALAGLVGCSVAMLKRIEADERRPSLQLAERLASYLRVSPAEQPAFLSRARGLAAPNGSLADTGAPVHQLLPAASRLPAEPTSFVGRAAELGRIAGMLADPACRLLTVTGPGGVGKSRLALRAAGRLTDGQRAWWVPLAEVATPALLAPTILEHLPRQVTAPADPEAALLALLASREALLVLDNFEQLLAADSQAAVALVLRLLERCPRLTLLVTSRERLNVQVEWLLPLTGLPLDDAATALFVARAQQVQPAFGLQGQEAAVDEICRLVDGLPLAVELAAGWTHALSCAQIAQQIRHRPEVLATPLRDIPERHRSLDALFEQSWRLLPADQRTLWMQLAVFHDGFTVEDMGAVCGAELATLRALVDKSLLGAAADGRFKLHALARHYAGRQLAASGNADELRRRHLAVYLALAEQAAAQFDGPEAEHWLQRLDRELANLRAAWDCAVNAADTASLNRLVRPFTLYWQARGYLQEGIDRLEQVLAGTASDDAALETAVLIAYGALLGRSGNLGAALLPIHTAYERASRGDDPYLLGMAALNMAQVAPERDQRLHYCRTAVGAFRAADSRLQLGVALWRLGDELRVQVALDEARLAYTESLDIARAIGNVQAGVYPLGNLGRLALLEGDVAGARRRFAECVELARRSGNRVALTDWLLRLGVVTLYRGRPAEARAALEEARGLADEMAYHIILPNILAWQALEAVAAGDLARAGSALKQSLQGHTRLIGREGAPEARSTRPDVLDALQAAAQVHAAGGRAGLAALALGRAEQITRAQGYRLEPPLQDWLADLRSTVREALSEAEWQTQQAEGQTLPLAELLARLAGSLAQD